MSTSLRGHHLLENPLLNKGTAFTEAERVEFGLLGLLPPHQETLDEQIARSYGAYSAKDSDMERHIYLRNLQDTNETLFYGLLIQYLTEMMPMLYTPVVGEACQKFSEIYRRPRGLFISYPERESIDQILDNSMIKNVGVIVVTDGGRILGLGDQGAGGLGIPIGKLSLYTGCGGIDPSKTLPIILDVGTDNQERINDPMYIGWRHERIKGQEYENFLDLFVQAVKRKWPDVLLQFEDFAIDHATLLLERYRDQLCVFNDDIQGTAAVTCAALLSAAKVTGGALKDQTVVFLGAGSAGCGIAELLILEMVREGLDEKTARSKFYMVDIDGLMHDRMDGLPGFKQRLAQPYDRVADWASGADGEITLMDVIRRVKASILVGVSGQPGLFTEEIVREMARHSERPIVLPLSNPTSRSEAVPVDIIEWTEGRALVATGSPFDPVKWDGREIAIGQCNNSYIFPGMGLGVLAANARRVSDTMFMAAAAELSECSPALSDPTASLMPALKDIRTVSKRIGFAVAKQAQVDGLAEEQSDEALKQRIDEIFWEPKYGSPVA